MVEDKDKLTGREKEVILWVIRGFTNKEIARKLSISPRTVESHINNVMLKTGAKNRINMAALIILKNLLRITLADFDESI